MSTPAPLADAHARDRIAKDLDTTLVVEAAAGTGKTTALVGRIVAIVRAEKATLKQIIAVTFTEKAAGEMKLRLRGELEKARQAPGATPKEKAALETALEELEVARIGTIHALCADLLREHPIEARVDPLFEVSKEPEAQSLLDAAFDSWLPEILRAPPEGVRRLLRRRPKRRDQVAPRELLRRAAWQLIGHRDFTAPWAKPPFPREQLLEGLLPKLRELGALAKQGEKDDYLADNLRELQRFIDDLEHREQAGTARDWDGLEAGLAALSRHRTWSYKGFGEKYGGTLLRSEVIAKRDALKAELDAVLEQAEAHLAACLHADLWPLVDRYEVEKKRSGKLDFFDLLIKLEQLLVEDAKVRAELQARFTHLFVDEFQDTDPLQADILRLLAADDPTVTDPELARPRPGKLFIVGDPKQSIYRFRRADVALYETIKRKLEAEVIDLTTSFRGAPKLQQAINTAFQPVMVQDEASAFHTQARYVKLDRFRDDIEGQPSLIALPVPRPYSEYGKISTWQVDRSYPDAVGAFVDWLVHHSGWKVQEPGVAEERLVPVQARHVCILFRRFRRWEGDDVTLGYTRALEARSIPHVLVGGRSFHGREEVLALRNALAAIEWPDDELSVYATLRGPLFALGDDALLVYKDTAKRGFRAFRRVDAATLPPAAQEVSRALDVIAELHKRRNRRPIGDTVALLLEATRAPAGVAFWPAGEQALANLAQLTDLARRYEAGGGRSFRGFVDQLARQAERGEVPEAPIVEEASEGVRMMTVHGAKGLEFPVVILADPSCPMTQKNPSQWVEGNLWAESLAYCVPKELRDHAAEALKRDHEEAVRLTYVAATRARDLLVVPVVGDEELPGWVDVLHPVLYPGDDDKRRARPAPGSPKFGPESVLERPEKARFRVSVQPGLHTSEKGQHQVVWWEPKALELDKKLETGLHQDQVLHEKGGEENAARSLAEYQAWAARREALLKSGQQPSIEVLAAREALTVAAVPVTIEATAVKRDRRPRGKRFGALVHAALADVPLHGAELELFVAAHARRLGATDEEQAAAIEAVQAAVQHPLMARAAAAQVTRREAPLMVRLSDGKLAEGVADLAFREGERWVVVDFKTDFELEERRADYERQLAVYAQAITAATGQSATAWLLSVPTNPPPPRGGGGGGWAGAVERPNSSRARSTAPSPRPAPLSGEREFSRMVSAVDYAALTAQLRSYRRLARITTYGHLTEQRRYELLRMDTPGKPRVLITAGFHGEEPAGPLTLATHFEKIAAHAQKRGVGLTIFPCINPSGFELGTRYNASLEKPNNDFLRYQLEDGTLAGELYGQAPAFRKWKLHPQGPKETRAVRKQLEKIATPIAALDLHQDNYMRRAATYAYVFGDARWYAPLARRASRHLPLASNTHVDPRLDTDEHGFIWFHDGSVTDWFMRRGTRYCATLETTTQSDLNDCHAVNRVWIEGFIDLAARARYQVRPK